MNKNFWVLLLYLSLSLWVIFCCSLFSFHWVTLIIFSKPPLFHQNPTLNPSFFGHTTSSSNPNPKPTIPIAKPFPNHNPHQLTPIKPESTLPNPIPNHQALTEPISSHLALAQTHSAHNQPSWTLDIGLLTHSTNPFESLTHMPSFQFDLPLSYFELRDLFFFTNPNFYPSITYIPILLINPFGPSLLCEILERDNKSACSSLIPKLVEETSSIETLNSDLRVHIVGL